MRKDNDYRNKQPQSECDYKDVFTHGRRRQHAAVRWGDNAGIVGRERLREFVFFTLLQQEQVKSLLYLLLAFHRKQIFGLRWVGRYA